MSSSSEDGGSCGRIWRDGGCEEIGDARFCRFDGGESRRDMDVSVLVEVEKEAMALRFVTGSYQPSESSPRFLSNVSIGLLNLVLWEVNVSWIAWPNSVVLA